MITGRLQEKSNHWYCILNLHHPDGKRQQKWVSTGLKVKGNKKQADAILQNLRREYTVMNDVERNASGISFADYMQVWLKSLDGHIAKSTFSTYSDIVEKSIVPYFRSCLVPLIDLKPLHIEEYYDYLYEKGLSPNTILHHHANIHKALREAQKRELIAGNVAALVDKPRKQKFIPEPYSCKETVRLLECVKDDQIELPVHLAAFYGLRRSEVAGLMWKDINFEKGTITIRHSLQRRATAGKPRMIAQSTLKRDASYRTLPLCPEIAILLKLYPKNHDRMGVHKHKDYIFRMSDGEVMKPAYISARFSKLLAKYGLRHIRFHDLRHGCAGMLIAERVPLIEVQQWLGHGSISTTADMYAHLDYSVKERSAATLKDQLYTHK